MGNKSFYDPDYIIEINEQRLGQYADLHQKSVERFTTLLVIYSTFCIFLVPVIQTLFFNAEQYHWSYYCSFYLFCILFIISIIYSVMLLSPEALYILNAPTEYYREIRQILETENIPPAEIDFIIKSYYITELEETSIESRLKLNRKISFYKRAFHLAIIACIPYLHCVWLQINSEKKINLKNGTINKSSNFTKTNHICGGKNQNTRRSTITWLQQ